MSPMKAGSEAAWQVQVTNLARFYDWRVYHPPDNKPEARGRRQSVVRGFPDLVLVRPPELLFVELKTETGRLGPGQAEWLKALQAVGDAVEDVATGCFPNGSGPSDWPGVWPAVEVFVWRPSDFDEAQARLARGRRRWDEPRT